MIFTIIFFVIVIIVVVRAASKAAAPGQNVAALDAVGATGIPARGLVLSASPFVIPVTISGRRFEKRTMTLDVEIEGREPYVSSGEFLVPRGLVEALPGASLELAVDPSNPDSIAVLGPGGVTGPWIRLGPPQPY